MKFDARVRQTGAILIDYAIAQEKAVQGIKKVMRENTYEDTLHTLNTFASLITVLGGNTLYSQLFMELFDKVEKSLTAERQEMG